MPRIIYTDECYCQICKQMKKVVTFEEEEQGYNGYKVFFDICKDCYDDTYNNLEDGKIIKN